MEIYMKEYIAWVKRNIKNFLCDETVDEVMKKDNNGNSNTRNSKRKNIDYDSYGYSKIQYFCYKKHWKIIFIISLIFFSISLILSFICRFLYDNSWFCVIFISIAYILTLLIFVLNKNFQIIYADHCLVYEIFGIICIILIDFIQAYGLIKYLSN